MPAAQVPPRNKDVLGAQQSNDVAGAWVLPNDRVEEVTASLSNTFWGLFLLATHPDPN